MAEQGKDGTSQVALEARKTRRYLGWLSGQLGASLLLWQLHGSGVAIHALGLVLLAGWVSDSLMELGRMVSRWVDSHVEPTWLLLGVQLLCVLVMLAGLLLAVYADVALLYRLVTL